ncbi:MAG: TIR domain-containing protein [Desulfobaccales bacterium]
MTMEEKQFDVALSFAGEDRKYVEEVASNLRKMGIKVFYDKYEIVTLWGKNLYDHLQDVYQNKAKYTVIFVSKHYADKIWTNHERKSAQAKAFVSNQEYILPARFDETEIPGLLPTVGYINVLEYSPKEFAELIKKKIGIIRRYEFFPDEPDLLYKNLKAKSQKKKNIIKIFAQRFFDNLKLMTSEERRLLYETIAHSCPYGRPENVHLNIEFLSRNIGKSIEEIEAMYSRLGCFDIIAKIKMEEHEEDQICKEFLVIQIEYRPLYADLPEIENATFIPIELVRIFEEHLCPECRKMAWDNLDFSIISSLTGFPES